MDKGQIRNMDKEQIKKWGSKYNGILIMAVLALVIGLVLTIQIKTTNGEYSGGLVPLAKVQALATELNQIKAEKDLATKELLEVEKNLQELEREKASEDQHINAIVSELEKYKMLSGVLDVKGPGIIITVEDPVVSGENLVEGSVIIYNAELLLSLVNKLKDAGAEAISINGERITAVSEISMAGDNININARATAPPYEIKAIGNSTTLESTVSIRFGIVEKMRTSYGLKVTIAKKDEIVVPRYNKVLQFRYAQPVESEE